MDQLEDGLTAMRTNLEDLKKPAVSARRWVRERLRPSESDEAALARRGSGRPDTRRVRAAALRT